MVVRKSGAMCTQVRKDAQSRVGQNLSPRKNQEIFLASSKCFVFSFFYFAQHF